MSQKQTFSPVPNPPDFPALEKETIEWWAKERIFLRSIEEREGSPDFVFYDGPPGTNAPPHIGHMMQSALKDLWPRYQTMRGKRVLRMAGWDTHGLPIELTADRDLKLESKRQIEQYGVQKYIDYCRDTVFRFKESWEHAIRRLGRFLDLEDFYATYTTRYIQSDWWVLKQAFETQVSGEFVNPANLIGGNRLLYKDYRISAWCPKQGTTLSNFEVAQGYKDVTELALFPKFRVVGEENTYLVAWTTTAWTLLSNIAVAVGPDISYVRIKLKEDKGGKTGDTLIIAKERLEAVARFLGEYEIVGTVKGSSLDGMKYLPLWDWQNLAEGNKAHVVIADTYVTTEDGTGMVHLAPYGEDDFRIMKDWKLPTRLMVSEHGIVEPEAGEFAGHWFKDDQLEIKIIKDLATRNLLFGKEKHEHTYPFHYKTGSPLMYFPRPGWFIRTTALREQMLEANSLINWVPGHIRDGRFGKWLENVIDWNITRERYWGSPLPIWTSADGSEAVCIGSIEELNRHILASGGEPLAPDSDLHKPGIDRIVLRGSKGQELRREDFVLDSWFNAGIMPWGQIGYPAAKGSKEYFANQYPADFICEGLDQTRGWFYSLLACSVLLATARKDEDKRRWSSYRTVICTDLVLDEKGEKMSKSKGNVVPPIPMMDKYGADAVRWSFFRNNPWLPVRFGEETLRECLRQVMIPLWNAYSFFTTYAIVDGWTPEDPGEMADATEMDRWILAGWHDLILEVTDRLENYDVMPAATAITDFIDRLTNWYIRRSRRRFWKSEEAGDKRRAYFTLYTILTGLSRLLAPFTPFLAEQIYQNLVVGKVNGAKDSVHLDSWPVVDPAWRDDALKSRMDRVRKIVSLGRAAREEAKVKVRQPLPEMIVVLNGAEAKSIDSLTNLILDELNVKEIRFVASKDQLVGFRVKPNFRTLGPRFGGEMKAWADKIVAASGDQIAAWNRGETVQIDGQGIGVEEVQVYIEVPDYLAVKEEGDLLLALDLRLDETLIDEGYVRELLNKIQTRRKEMDFEVSQRILLSVECDDRLHAALEQHRDLVAREVLATEVTLKPLSGNDELVKINDRSVRFELQPAG